MTDKYKSLLWRYRQQILSKSLAKLDTDSNECESENSLDKVDKERQASVSNERAFIKRMSAGTGEESINCEPED